MGPGRYHANVPGDPRHFIMMALEHRGERAHRARSERQKWAPGAGYGAAVDSHQDGIPVRVGW